MAYQGGGGSSWGGGGGGSRKRLAVPSSAIGRLIGRGGSKIRELQDQSGCQIRVLQNEDAPGGAGAGMTCVEVSYSSDSEFEYASQLIDQVVQEAAEGGGGGYGGRRGGGEGYGGGGGYSSGGGNFNATIPEDCVGMIIGKGGARIKDIEARVGCPVRVKNDGNGNHFANVQGTEAQFRQVQEIISDTIERQKSRGGY